MLAFGCLMAFEKLFYFEICCFLTWWKSTASKWCFRYYIQDMNYTHNVYSYLLILANLLAEKILVKIRRSSISCFFLFFVFVCFVCFPLWHWKHDILQPFTWGFQKCENYGKSVRIVGRLDWTYPRLVSFIYYYNKVEYNFWNGQ